MAAQLPPKLISETITVEFDFLGDLSWEEGIDSATVSVEVFSGLDYSPSDILSGATSFSGSVVSQDIQAGMGGVIYLLIATVEGSSGTTYVQTKKLAVLTDNGAFNPASNISLSGVLPDGYARVDYSEVLTISGGFPPYEFDDIIAGTSPPWMSFNISDDQLICAGFPTNTETTEYTFTPQVRDQVNGLASAAQSPTFLHLVISGDVLDGVIGEDPEGFYTQVNGVGAVTYVVTSGTFPAGLTLNSDGTVSGQFTNSAIYTWEVTGTDSVGNTYTISDTCTVLGVSWWYTYADPVGVQYRNIWIGADNVLSFPTMVTPSPFAVGSAWGAVSIEPGLAFVLSGVTNNYKKFPIVGDFGTSSSETFPASISGPKYFYNIDGVLFLINDNDATYYYSTDQGETWGSAEGPDGRPLLSIAKVGSVWVCISQLQNNAVWFWRSTLSIPTSWTGVMPADPNGATGYATGWFASSGEVAVIFNNGGYCHRTTDGLTYESTATGFDSGDNRDCVYYHGVFVGGILQDGHVVRSDDGGVTWTRILLGGGTTVLKRVDAANGLIVASMSDGIWVSDDLGLTWTKSTTPHGSSSLQWCGHVLSEPSV